MTFAGARFASRPFAGSLLNYLPTTGSASVALTGAANDSLTFAVSGTASLTLTAAANDALTFPVAGSGSLTLTGAANDALSFASTGSGSITLTGAVTDVLQFATTGSGSVTLTGNANNGLSTATTGTGSLTLTGTAYSYPSAATTGVPVGITLTTSGPITATANQVIQNLDITGRVTIPSGATNVVIKNCKIHGDAYYGILVNSGTLSVTIQDCEIYGVSSAAISTASVSATGASVTILRCNIYGVEDGVVLGNNTTVQDCYIHDLAATSTTHCDGIQVQVGVVNSSIVHNAIYSVVSATGVTSAIFISPDQGPSASGPLSITDNLLSGGGQYTFRFVNGTDAVTSAIYHQTGVTFSNNRFVNNALAAPVQVSEPSTAFTAYSNNTFIDTGAAISNPGPTGFSSSGSGSLTLSASATTTSSAVLSTTGSGSLTLSGALAGASASLPSKVQTSAIKPAIGGSIYQFNAVADAVGKTVSLYAGSTLLLTSASHRSGTFTNMQLTLRWDSTAIVVLSSSGTVLVWHDLSATERADLIAGITVGSWTGTGITPGTSVLGSWSYRLSAYMKKSIGRSPRLWSVWAVYPAGLDFILNETTGAAYFQDGTDQDEYANPNLTVLRGGFAYDLATTFAARVANAGGTEFLSTSPADVIEILTDPYTGATNVSGSASLSLSASAQAGLGVAGITSIVGQPAQTFAGATFAGTVGSISAPTSGGTTSYPTSGTASITLSGSCITGVIPGITVSQPVTTFAGMTFGGTIAGVTTSGSGGTTSYPTTGSGSVTLTASASTSSSTVTIGLLTFAGSTLAGACL